MIAARAQPEKSSVRDYSHSRVKTGQPPHIDHTGSYTVSGNSAHVDTAQTIHHAVQSDVARLGGSRATHLPYCESSSGRLQAG